MLNEISFVDCLSCIDLPCRTSSLIDKSDSNRCKRTFPAKQEQFKTNTKFIIKLTLTLAGTEPDQYFHRSRIILAKENNILIFEKTNDN